MEKELSEKEVLVNEISSVALLNASLLLDDRLREFKELLTDVADVKFNAATLATLLQDKGIFTQKEYRSCFNAIVASFGKVDEDGNMHGRVVITDYNLGG